MSPAPRAYLRPFFETMSPSVVTSRSSRGWALVPDGARVTLREMLSHMLSLSPPCRPPHLLGGLGAGRRTGRSARRRGDGGVAGRRERAKDHVQNRDEREKHHPWLMRPANLKGSRRRALSDSAPSILARPLQHRPNAGAGSPSRGWQPTARRATLHVGLGVERRRLGRRPAFRGERRRRGAIIAMYRWCFREPAGPQGSCFRLYLRVSQPVGQNGPSTRRCCKYRKRPRVDRRQSWRSCYSAFLASS